LILFSKSIQLQYSLKWPWIEIWSGVTFSVVHVTSGSLHPDWWLEGPNSGCLNVSRWTSQGQWVAGQVCARTRKCVKNWSSSNNSNKKKWLRICVIKFIAIFGK
jgi:hypothetical protein